MGVMARGNSGHKTKGGLSLSHNQEFGWNLHLNLNLAASIISFGPVCASPYCQLPFAELVVDVAMVVCFFLLLSLLLLLVF